MTLNTSVYVHDRADTGAIFHLCRELLGAADRHTFTDEPCGYRNGEWAMAHPPGLGLPAWLMIYHRAGAFLRPDADACDGNCWTPGEGEEGEPEHFHRPAMWCEVTFDTGYAYRDEQGRGCGDLHACLVAALGQWLDTRGVTWSWVNEFDGAVYGGEDRYARLTELMQAGHRATEWFGAWVLPAIAAHVTRRPT